MSISFSQIPMGTFHLVQGESCSWGGSAGICQLGVRNQLLITKRGRLKNGKIYGPNILRPPPPSRQGKTFLVPALLVWLRFEAPLLKLPQKVLPPPPRTHTHLSMGQTCSAPPLFVGVKLHLPPPPSQFLALPPPPSVINGRSFRCGMRAGWGGGLYPDQGWTGTDQFTRA